MPPCFFAIYIAFFHAVQRKVCHTILYIYRVISADSKSFVVQVCGSFCNVVPSFFAVNGSLYHFCLCRFLTIYIITPVAVLILMETVPDFCHTILCYTDRVPFCCAYPVFQRCLDLNRSNTCFFCFDRKHTICHLTNRFFIFSQRLCLCWCSYRYDSRITCSNFYFRMAKFRIRIAETSFSFFKAGTYTAYHFLAVCRAVSFSTALILYMYIRRYNDIQAVSHFHRHTCYVF